VEDCPLLLAAIQALETSHGGDLRMVIRWSGTEPKLRLMVEAKAQDLMNSALQALESAARTDLALD
jgi:phosphoglucosamine mutase